MPSLSSSRRTRKRTISTGEVQLKTERLSGEEHKLRKYITHAELIVDAVEGLAEAISIGATPSSERGLAG